MPIAAKGLLRVANRGSIDPIENAKNERAPMVAKPQAPVRQSGNDHQTAIQRVDHFASGAGLRAGRPRPNHVQITEATA